MKISATRDVYTFAELSPAAQDKALENLSNVAWEYLDNDMVSEEINGEFIYLATGNVEDCVSDKQLKDRYGISISWRVSYTQGDGVAISGKLLRSETPNLSWPDGINGLKIKETYLGWSSIEYVIVLDDDGDEIEQYNPPVALFDAANKFIDDLCRKLHRYAVDTCEGYTSKDYVLSEYHDFGMTRRFTNEGNFAPNEFWTDDKGDNQ